MSHEPLSALLDGECSAAELDRLLDEMERSPQLKQAYSRLCLAREAGEGTRIIRGQPCISSGVMARLPAESMADAAGATVTDLDSRRRWMPSRLRSAGGLAAAASVAAVAVMLAFPALKQDRSNAGGLLPQVSAPADFAPVSMPMTRRARDLRAVAYTPEQAEQMDELSGFLMQHNSTLAEQGVGGMLRHTRLAANTQPQSPLAEIPAEPEYAQGSGPEDRR